jgi:hypothetical protein
MWHNGRLYILRKMFKFLEWGPFFPLVNNGHTLPQHVMFPDV